MMRAVSQLLVPGDGCVCKIHTELEVPATPAAVWAVLGDFARWGEWNDFMALPVVPQQVGRPCKVVFHLDKGCMKRSTHEPEVRERVVGGERGGQVFEGEGSEGDKGCLKAVVLWQKRPQLGPSLAQLPRPRNRAAPGCSGPPCTSASPHPPTRPLPTTTPTPTATADPGAGGWQGAALARLQGPPRGPLLPRQPLVDAGGAAQRRHAPGARC